MGSPWIEDDEDESWDAAVADGPTGTPLPYLDPSVAAELAQDGPPAWLGTRWREIEAGHQWEAWNALRRWVDWFIAEYRLTTSVVPACWYRHSDLVAELYGAMCMEYKVWEEQAPGLGPMMMWHPHVEVLAGRLRRMVDEAGCSKTGQHKEPEAYGNRPAFTLDYNEDNFTTWAATTREEDTLERPQEKVTYLRARLLDGQGQEIAVSAPVGLGARRQEAAVGVEVQLISSSPADPSVRVTVSNATEDMQVEWQMSPDARYWASP